MKVIIHERKMKTDDELLLEFVWPDVSGLAATAGHFALDIGGLVPGYGILFDGANAAWYAAEEDWLMTGMSIAAALPVFGWGAAAVKITSQGVAIPFRIARQFTKDAKIFNKAVDKFTKAAGLGKDVAKKIKDAVAARMSGKAIKPVGKLAPPLVGKKVATAAKKEVKEIGKLFDGVVEKIPLSDALKKDYMQRVLELKKLNSKLDGLAGTKNSAALSKLTKEIKDKERLLYNSMSTNQLKVVDMKRILAFSKVPIAKTGVKAGAKAGAKAGVKTAGDTSIKTAVKSTGDFAIKIKNALVKHKGKLPTLDSMVKKKIITFIRKGVVKSLSFQIDYQRLKDEFDKTDIVKLLEELDFLGLQEIFDVIKNWACETFKLFCDVPNPKPSPDDGEDEPKKPDEDPENSIRCDKMYQETGCRGENVRLLQRTLIYLGGPLAVGRRGADGIFGSQTRRGVKNFQEKYNLEVTGIADKPTWDKLIEVIEALRVKSDERENGKVSRVGSDEISDGELENAIGSGEISDKEIESAVAGSVESGKSNSKSGTPYWMSNKWTRLNRHDQKGPQGQALKKELIAQGWAAGRLDEDATADLNSAIKSIQRANKEIVNIKRANASGGTQKGTSKQGSPMRVGSKGPMVKNMQRRLGIKPTGVFDKTMEKAVFEFQRKNFKKVDKNGKNQWDGVIGPNTYGKLAAAEDAADDAAREADIPSHVQESKVHKNFHYDIIQEKMLRLNAELMKDYKKG